MGERMNPWHDCPPCPNGCGHVGVPIRAGGWNHRADPDKHNLVCPACGAGWEGTPEEVEQAERAQLAWEAKRRAEHLNEALRVLEARQLIRIEYGGLRILDLQGLRTAQF